ncbi:MAG: DUF349 domain-containing protein, partial [Bacteroidales bacterium]|nr:DUF349 domain-containing protein [Bacteroidales bacterium]
MSTEMENKLNNLEIGAENSVQNEIIGENLPIEAETVTENNVAQEILPEIGEDEIKEPVAEVMAEAKLVETTEDVFISANEIEEHEAILGEADAEESTEHSSTDFSGLNNDDIIEKLRFLIHETNVEESRKAIESLKNQFYKNLKNEQDRLKAEIKENTGDDIEVELPKDAREEYLKELMADYRKKKAELNQLLEAEKLNNLKLKEEIIEKIKGLANSENPLNKTFAEFKSLQQEWLTIGPVPNTEANNLWKSYQLQIERFYDLVKINNELRDLDFKRNLEQKVELCEKAEELLLMTDVVAAYKQLQEYHDLWKELGPVPTDKREEIWDRFSITSKKIRQNYQDHFEKLKEERNANYEQKVILCEKAESS